MQDLVLSQLGLCGSQCLAVDAYVTVVLFCFVSFKFFSNRRGCLDSILCRWCMLGVCFLLAFIRLGHECQEFSSPYNFHPTEL